MEEGRALERHDGPDVRLRDALDILGVVVALGLDVVSQHELAVRRADRKQSVLLVGHGLEVEPVAPEVQACAGRSKVAGRGEVGRTERPHTQDARTEKPRGAHR